MAAFSTIFVSTFSARARRSERQETAAEVLRLLWEPLSYATGDLQSRMWNILEGRLKETAGESDERRSHYFVTNTAFLVGQYLAWAEAVRLSVSFAGGPTIDPKRATQEMVGVLEAFADLSLGKEFLLYPGEQRAVGELCLGKGAAAALRGEVPARVVRIQHALVDLISQIDGKGAYTPKDHQKKWQATPLTSDGSP